MIHFNRVPFETRSKWIRPLPKHLAERHIVSVFQAGIANVVPATRRLNYVDMKTCTTRTELWSPDAIRTFEEIVANVETMRFARTTMLEDPDDENNHIFGHLEFTTYSGIHVNPALALQEFDFALPLCEKRFDHDIQTEKTRFTPRWLDNNQVKRINDNGTTENCMRPPPGFDGDTDYICGVKKVSDWQMRNQRTPKVVAAELDGLDTASGVRSVKVVEMLNGQAHDQDDDGSVEDPPKSIHFREEDDGEEQFDLRCASRNLNTIPFGLKKVAAADGYSIGGESSVHNKKLQTNSKVQPTDAASTSSVSTKNRYRGQRHGITKSIPEEKPSVSFVESPSKTASPTPTVVTSPKVASIALQKLQRRSQLLANLKANEKPIEIVSPKTADSPTVAKVEKAPEKKPMTAFQHAAKQDQW